MKTALRAEMPFDNYEESREAYQLKSGIGHGLSGVTTSGRSTLAGGNAE